jgi:hypothetical protein
MALPSLQWTGKPAWRAIDSGVILPKSGPFTSCFGNKNDRPSLAGLAAGFPQVMLTCPASRRPISPCGSSPHQKTSAPQGAWSILITKLDSIYSQLSGTS